MATEKEKPFGLLAKFDSKMDEIAFYDLYRAYSFFYDNEDSRNTHMIKMLTQCRKKNINVDFRNVKKKIVEAEIA